MACCVPACLASHHGYHVAACSVANQLHVGMAHSTPPRQQRALPSLANPPSFSNQAGCTKWCSVTCGSRPLLRRVAGVEAIANRGCGRGCGCCGGDGAQQSGKQHVTSSSPGACNHPSQAAHAQPPQHTSSCIQTCRGTAAPPPRQSGPWRARCGATPGKGGSSWSPGRGRAPDPPHSCEAGEKTASLQVRRGDGMQGAGCGGAQGVCP